MKSGTHLVHEYENVVVTRSFSKVYGMAGLRLGWCYGPDWVIDVLTKIGPSFPVNTASFAAGIAAVKDTAHVDRVLAHNRKWIDELTRQFTACGAQGIPQPDQFVSSSSFHQSQGKSAAEANRWLNQNGIIPRQFAVEDFDNKLRFTVGKDDGMEKTISVMRDFMQS